MAETSSADVHAVKFRPLLASQEVKLLTGGAPEPASVRRPAVARS